MKNILICSATYQEINPLLQWLRKNYSTKKINKNHLVVKIKHSYNIHILITGVGMVAMAYHLGTIQENIDIAINIGIAGSFKKNIKTGEVVIIKEDIFSELGAQDNTRFLRASQLKLANEIITPKKLVIPKIFSHLKQVRGITVNTVHGEEKSIQQIKKLFHPDIETMEGAAFYYVCNQKKWKCCQLKSISNYVEKRNKSNWNIPLAIEHLNTLIIQYIQLL